MNDDAMAIAYFWEPITVVAFLLIALGCLALVTWIIHEIKIAPFLDDNGNPITYPEPRPDPESPDRRAKSPDSGSH